MHEITGDKEVVQLILKDTIAYLKNNASNPNKSRSPVTGRSGKAAQSRSEQEKVADELQKGLDRIEPGKNIRGAGPKRMARGARVVETNYVPRDQAIALVQSAMDEYLDEVVGFPQSDSPKNPVKKTRGAPARKAVRVKATKNDFYRVRKKSKSRAITGFDRLVQFGDLDPRWIEVMTERAKLLFKGKRKFIAHKSTDDFRFRMGNQTTVAIVGDWGGGNAAAQAVAGRIRILKPDHVIHLGDVYYAGTPREVKNRFLKFWPAPKTPGRSFALNSNHEMYSGGYGYFDLTLKTFKQPASYFSLANDYWRLIGLDTGYVEHDLQNPQAQWLKRQLTGPAKNILLSHHQLFSAYEETDASKLRAKVQSVLGRIYGWIWGHEHLATVYKEHDGIKCVCLGNGCFPYSFPKVKPAVPVKWLDKRQGTNPDYPGGHTFALLRFQNSRLDIDFMDHQGISGNTETWRSGIKA